MRIYGTGNDGTSSIHQGNTIVAAALFAALIVLGVQSPQAFSQTIAVTHCGGECPGYESRSSAAQSNIVIHHLYAAGVNGLTSLPDWVAYRLNKEAIGVASLLPRTWQPDELIRYSSLEDIVQAEDEEIMLSDTIARNNNPYGGGGMERVEPEKRVRLAPMTSFANTPFWPELNNFSNMLPMPAALRLGPWLQLEQRLNRIATLEGEIYVLAGPVFLIDRLSLSTASVDEDPTGYYKLVADDSGVAAFHFPGDMIRAESYCKGMINLTELEALTGLEFFPGRQRINESRQLLEKLGCI